MPNSWHEVHLGSRAVGGASLVFTEATAVVAGRADLAGGHGNLERRPGRGVGEDRALDRAGGAVPGMQLAHAGRKAGTDAPWRGGGRLAIADGGWQPVAPSAIPVAEGEPAPTALDAAGIREVVDGFRDAAVRAARRRLPRRRDPRRARLPAARVPLAADEHAHRRVRRQLREPGPAACSRSSTRFAPSGRTSCRSGCGSRRPTGPKAAGTSTRASSSPRVLATRGVDLIDVSSGGAVRHQQVVAAPGYQVPFAERIRREAGIATGAVGLITEPAQADAIIATGQADVVLLARELLRDPYFPRRAAEAARRRADGAGSVPARLVAEPAAGSGCGRRPAERSDRGRTARGRSGRPSRPRRPRSRSA